MPKPEHISHTKGHCIVCPGCIWEEAVIEALVGMKFYLKYKMESLDEWEIDKAISTVRGRVL